MLFLGCFLFLLHSICVFAAVTKGKEFKLNIIHYNDFHARFEETSVKDAICRVNNGSCLGGFPRLYHHIHTLLAEKPDALLLNVGDIFQGTYWYTLLKWNVAQQFINLLPHDAHAIGNHEFDDGPEGLVPYLKGLKAPVLAANLDTSDEPSFAGTYQPSIIVERHGRKIGIIGLITVDTEVFAPTGKVKFTDPGEATKREAEALTKQGVDIIVILSHCGLAVDKQLARDYGKYIDIIVGGHTHSLLWNGPAPSGEPVAGPYPVFVKSSADNKHKVLIVQASSFTKYMGNLSVYFDSHGDYVKWEGGPIFLDRSIPEDLNIKKKLEPYAKLVHEAENRSIGRSLVMMDAVDCGAGECILGDMLADALVEYAKTKVDPTLNYLAFVQRGNMEAKKLEKGTITQVNAFDIYPYLDKILHFELKGEFIWQVLESAVLDAKSLKPFDGPWLQQISGLQVTYDLSKPEGHRVVSVKIVGGKSCIPLNENKYYHVLTAKFATFYGKGFPEIFKFAKNIQEIGRDRTSLDEYVKKHSPLNVTTNARIVII